MFQTETGAVAFGLKKMAFHFCEGETQTLYVGVGDGIFWVYFFFFEFGFANFNQFHMWIEFVWWKASRQ